MEESQTIPLNLNNYVWFLGESRADCILWDPILNTPNQLKKLSGKMSFRDLQCCQCLSTEHLQVSHCVISFIVAKAT